MHQSLYCLAASTASVFLASTSDYQSQTPKGKCCCRCNWLQQVLIFKYHWHYPPRNGFPHASSFKKSPAHLYLTRQLSCPSSPNAAGVCGEAPPGRGVWFRAGGSRAPRVLLWVCSATKGKNPPPPTRSVRPCNPGAVKDSGAGAPSANLVVQKRGAKPRRTLGPSLPAQPPAFLSRGASKRLLSPQTLPAPPQPRAAAGAGAQPALPRGPEPARPPAGAGHEDRAEQAAVRAG